MSTVYTERATNIRKTWFLLSFFFVFLIAIFWVFSVVYNNPAILVIGVVLAIFMNITSYWFSDKIVISMAGAKPVDPSQNRELVQIVENLAITAGLPTPKIYIVSDPAPNAFATGRDAKHAVVCVTTGILERLDKKELEGVLAHELSHIGNRDILVSTVVVVLAGIIALVSDFFLRMTFWGGMRRDDRDGGGILIIVGIVAAILAPIAATLIRLAISRQREYLADASGVLLTRYPEGLISALRKISADPRQLATASNATAHLYFENPFKADTRKGGRNHWIMKLFMTHPPVEDRIRELEKMQ